MTIGIEFPEGINSFKKGIIEKSENINELRRLISIDGKNKVNNDIDQAQTTEKDETLGIGINVNIID